jgi:geranylgeranyl diphosphate synthase type II
MTGTTFEAFAAGCRRDLERALSTWLPRPPECPQGLHDAMQYSLLAGGKRMRPVLVLAAADAIGLGHPDARALALPAACALEMIHTYSLVHDDLPAMDNDTLRRGRPTAHVVYGDAMAILSGDGLLTEAFALLAREPALDGPAIASRKLQTLELIARSAGAWGMVGGQALDLQFEGAARQENADDDLRPPLAPAPSWLAAHPRKWLPWTPMRPSWGSASRSSTTSSTSRVMRCRSARAPARTKRQAS